MDLTRSKTRHQVAPSRDTRRATTPDHAHAPSAPDVPGMQQAVADPANAAPSAILSLQRSYGNQAVQGLLAPGVQRSAPIGAEGGTPDGALQHEIQSQRGGGQPLDPAIGSRMGQAFGADFSGVKVHTDGRSHHLNRSLNASAFTVGSDIFFTKGSYAPGGSQGRQLLAHELTHVVQQNPGLAQRKPDGAKPNKVQAKPGAAAPQRRLSPARPNKLQTKLVVGAAGDSYEQEADRVAAEVMRSMASPSLAPQSPAGIQPEQEPGERVARQVDVRGAAPAATVQRAIGFEFEFGEWDTKHENDGSQLAKGEEIIRGDGFKVEGEDASTHSAIEVVTKPYTTKGEAVASVDKAQTILQDIADGVAPVKASDHGGLDNIAITPVGAAGKFQASPAIALDKMGALYGRSGGEGFATAITSFLKSKDVKKKYLNKQAPSEELMGLVMLVVSYLEQSSRKQPLFYPKSAFTIMARTSFDKMLELLPEYDFFSDPSNQQKWVNLILSTAQRVIPTMREQETGKFKKNIFGQIKRKGGKAIPKKRKRSLEEIKGEAVMGMPLMDIEPLPGDEAEKPGYKLNTTREEWLLGMTQGEDKLSKGEDKRFEGMGAYGGAMDVEALEEEGRKDGELALDKSGLIEKVEMDKVEDTETVQAPKPKKAPLFELRGLRDMFGIQQDVDLENWVEKVEAVFDIVDEVNGQSFKPGGKPTVAPDVDKPAIWDKV